MDLDLLDGDELFISMLRVNTSLLEVKLLSQGLPASAVEIAVWDGANVALLRQGDYHGYLSAVKTTLKNLLGI